MGFLIEYKGWKFNFDRVPSPAELEQKYQERVAQLSNRTREPEAAQEAMTGECPLGPMQTWYFGLELKNPSYWNHGILWTPQLDCTPEDWRRGWAEVVRHHDALRFRYVREGDDWRQSYAPVDEDASFDIVDVLDGEDELTAVIRRAHASLDITRGPVARLYYLRMPAGPARLLFVIHHLSLDGHTWTILAGDLQQVAEQLHRGDTPKLLPKTTSYEDWVSALREEPVKREAVDYWLDPRFATASFELPLDRGTRADNREEFARTLSMKASREITERFLALDSSHHEPLLKMAVARAMAAWTGNSSVILGIEGNDRSEKSLGNQVNLSRSVGWFNTLYPILMDVSEEAGGGFAALNDQLRRVPRHTVRYMLARQGEHVENWQKTLVDQPDPDFLFSYYGLFQGEEARLAMRMMPLMRGPQNVRAQVLELYCYHDGHDLYFDWLFGSSVHDESTIEQLGNRALKALGELSIEAQVDTR